MNSIKSIAVATEQMLIRKDFTESERDKMQHEFMQQSFKLAKLSEEKKASAMAFDAEMKPIEKERVENFKALRQGFREVDEQVYLVPDHDRGFMDYYTEDSVLVQSRRLRPDEKQENFLRAISNQ